MSTHTVDASAPSTLADQAYQSVRSAIGSGEIEPGTKVTERGLADRLGVSATPVREAIRRLELDGLLERIGPRTVVVASIDGEAVHDLAEVEVALRGLAARFAARHATSTDLDALDALLDEADDLRALILRRREEHKPITKYVNRMLDVFAEFNDRVHAAAANPVLLRLIEQTRSFTPAERRARTQAQVRAGNDFGIDRYAGHRALVRALRERDWAAAERIVTDDAARALLDLRRS